MIVLQDAVGARFVDVLTDACIAQVADEEYKATLIKQGLFQEDPVKRRIALMVNPGNIDETSAAPRWANANAGADKETIRVPAYEIGGGGFQYLRYTIEISVFLVKTKEPQDKSRNIGMSLFARTCKALDNLPIGITDELGYSAIQAYVKSSSPYESGGQGSYIWKGKVFVEVLVAKPL